MSSNYCKQNPSVFQCALNPNYQPLGGGTSPTYTPVSNSGSWDFSQYDFSRTPVYNPSSNANVYNPATTTLPAGTQINITPLDKILATITSMTALFKNAPYVPTNIQPQQQGIDPATYAILAAQGNVQAGGGGTALGKVENWLKNNTGVALMGAGALALYLMKSPKSKSRSY